jgi:predicted metal-dependent peptidase
MEELMNLVRSLRIALYRKSPFLAFALDNMAITYVDDDNPKCVTVSGNEIKIYRNAVNIDAQEFAIYMVKALIHSVLYHSLRAARLYRRLGYDKEMENIFVKVAKMVDAVPITFRDVARVAAEIVAWRIFPRRLRGVAYRFDEEFLRKLLGDDWEGDSMENIFYKLLDQLSKNSMTIKALVEYAGYDVFDENFGKEAENGEDLDAMIGEAERRLVKVAAMTDNFTKNAGLEESTAIRRLIDDILKQKPLPWHVLLRRFLEGHYRKQFKTTWKYVSRKHPELPGYEMFNKPRLIAAVDVSGSIDDGEYSKFCREVLWMVKLGMEGHFVCWDTKAVDYGLIRVISDMRRRAEEVKGYGGTVVSCLAPVLDGLKVKAGDLLIVLSDGEWRESDDEAQKFIRRYNCSKILVTTKYKHGGFDLVVEVD